MVLVVIPILLTIILTNWMIDPAHLFNNKYYDKISSIIFSGYNVTGISDMDERKMQEVFINNMDVAPYTVVLGSSRVMLINRINYGDDQLFNNGVSGASIEDIISIYQLYKRSNKLPKRLVIGIDPWLFNENNNDRERWRSLEKYYMEYYGQYSNAISFHIYKQIISLSYFRESIYQLINEGVKFKFVTKTKNRDNELRTKLVDGSISYDAEQRNIANELIEERINNYLNRDINRLEGFAEINNTFQFESFIRNVISCGIKVELFLSPYPPNVYKHLKKHYPNALKVEEYITILTEELGLKLYGSYDPSVYGLHTYNFSDGLHCKRECIDLLLKK